MKRVMSFVWLLAMTPVAGIAMLWFCAVILMLCMAPLFATESPTVVPMTDTVTVTAYDAPQASLRNMTRAERKLAREVIADAADAAGMRRLEFMRAVNNGDVIATDELKMSLASHEEVREIDIERLKEIFQMILDFISQLMALFSLFADNATLDAFDAWCVNVGFQMAA